MRYLLLYSWNGLSWLFITGFIFFMAGCAAHYQKIQDKTVELYLDKPDAKLVSFASSLDGFDPHQLLKTKGEWVISLPSDDQFSYFYVVDGQIFLPDCRMKEKDDFGAENCVFEPRP